MTPTVFPTETEILKAVEDMAYEAMQDIAETATSRASGDYSHLGDAIYERPYRAGQLQEWPPFTDYRPDELEVRN